MADTYCVIRFYADPDLDNEVIATGLPLEEAMAHCQDPETSSATCTSPEALAITEAKGLWFDGFEFERQPQPRAWLTGERSL